MKQLFYCFLSGVAGYVICFLQPVAPAPLREPIVHFHGRFDAFKLCDGDDGELIGLGKYLTVRCADRRKVPITGGANMRLSSWSFDVGEIWREDRPAIQSKQAEE